MTRYRHAIWDWNGTLLDDFDITARITIDALAELGSIEVTPEQVRDHYCRPLDGYFSRLLGRDVTEDDLRHLGLRYDMRYRDMMHELSLASDAIVAIEVIGQKATQSLLSMAPHDQLNTLVDLHGLRPRFRLIEGFRGTGHPTKRESLVNHCAALGLEDHSLCLIGDTVDDHDAAAAAGIGSILVATGMQSRRRLESTGAPVVDSLSEAAAFFVAQ